MPEVPWPSPQQRVERFVRDYLPRIVQQYAPSEVWLWGSVAYGRPDEWSDLDIIVVSDRFEDGSIVRRAIALDHAVGISKGVAQLGPVDLLCYTPAEFEWQRNRITIVAEGIKKGKRLL